MPSSASLLSLSLYKNSAYIMVKNVESKIDDWSIILINNYTLNHYKKNIDINYLLDQTTISAIR